MRPGGDLGIGCVNMNSCPCPKRTCANNGNCCQCVIKHRETDSLPYCLFPDNCGDKSLENLYRKLKERYGDGTTEHKSEEIP